MINGNFFVEYATAAEADACVTNCGGSSVSARVDGANDPQTFAAKIPVEYFLTLPQADVDKIKTVDQLTTDGFFDYPGTSVP